MTETNFLDKNFMATIEQLEKDGIFDKSGKFHNLYNAGVMYGY